MERWGRRILLIALLVGGCSFTISSLSWASEERVVILGDYSVLRTLDPAFIGLSQEIMICRAVYQSLLR